MQPVSPVEKRPAERQEKVICWLLLAIAIIGAGLRLAQYLANPALFLDEVAVARNILERSLGDLLATPLAYDQSAPKGFLLVEKLATNVFGPSDYVLRLFPLICSIGALFVFRGIAGRVLDGAGAPIALALFAAAMPFVAFSAQVKQYSGDIAVSVLLLFLAFQLGQRDLSRRRALWAGAVGAVAVWFSQSSVFVLIGLSFALLLIKWRRPVEAGSRDLALLAPVLALWAGAAVATILTALATTSPATHDYMRRYWVSGMLPLPLMRAVKVYWPWNQLTILFSNGSAAGLGYPAPAVYVALAMLGFWRLWRQNRDAALLILAPIIMTLAAAAAHQYPFSDRLILFLVPNFFLAIAAAVEWIRRSVGLYSRTLMALVVCMAVAPALYATIETPPIYQMENVKPVLSYLRAKRRSGDAVYVYYGAVPAVTFYSASYGFREMDHLFGGCHNGNNRRYLEELDTFRGRKRLWIVMTHSYPPYREREDILRYLDTIGSRHDHLSIEPRIVGGHALPAELFLYDLSDPGRLRQALARSFELTGPAKVHPRFTCREGPQAMQHPASLSKSPRLDGESKEP